MLDIFLDILYFVHTLLRSIQLRLYTERMILIIKVSKNLSKCRSEFGWPIKIIK